MDELPLFFTAFVNIFYRAFFATLEIFCFFPSIALLHARWLLYSHYFFQDYWLKHQRKRLAYSRPEWVQEGDLTYGETFFWTAREILTWGGAKKGSTLWDLGCGRGAMVIFSAIYFGMRAVGVDVFPLFVDVGKLITRKLGLKNIEWIQGNFLELDFSTLPKPDFVYLASTTFSWQTLQALALKLEALPAGVRVVSLSARLPSDKFKELATKDFWFSWGKATAHLQERVEI